MESFHKPFYSRFLLMVTSYITMVHCKHGEAKIGTLILTNTDFIQTLLVFLLMSFPVPGLHPGTTLHSVIRSPWSPLVGDGFSVLPCLSLIDSLRSTSQVLCRPFLNLVLSARFISWLDWGSGFLGRMTCSSHRSLLEAHVINMTYYW